MKIVVNRCFGGFTLSKEAYAILNKSEYHYDDYSMRDSYDLIMAVETLGKNASGKHSCVEIAEIPDECTDYMISDYDGMESVYYVLGGKIYSCTDYSDYDSEEVTE